MKTLSNAELQEAIRYSTDCIKNSGSTSAICRFHSQHLLDLLYEQKLRATNRAELSIEPMEPAPGRVEFDARVRAQDGPEWVEHDTKHGRPVPHYASVEARLGSGEVLSGAALSMDWSNVGRSDSITHYRVIEGVE